MNAVNPAPASWRSPLLYCASLFYPGRARSFPCDRCGDLQLDGLSERVRNNYSFARTAVGRDYRVPIVIVLENGLTH